MNPVFDLKAEHDAMEIILMAMKKRAVDMRYNRQVDLFRIAQIIDFLRTYNDSCHHHKEEKYLFPAILEYDIPWSKETINHLVNEHQAAHNYLNEIEEKLHVFLSGQNQNLEALSFSMLQYIMLEENHIKTENEVLLPLVGKYFDKQKQDSVTMKFKTVQNLELSHQKHLEFYLLLTKLYAENKKSIAENY